MRDLEIRKEDEIIVGTKIKKIKPRIDEIVAKDVKQFHLEYMANNYVWIEIDGLHIDITASGTITTKAERR